MIIPESKQEIFRNPREAYRTTKDLYQIVVCGMFALISILAFISIITATISLTNGRTDIGTVSHHEVSGSGKSEYRYTVVAYRDQRFQSSDMKYGAAKNTGKPGTPISIIITPTKTIEITNAIYESRTKSIIWFSIFFIMLILGVLMFRREQNKNLSDEKFSDARAITLTPSPYYSKDWYETFPDLANIINPKTGNIDYDYIPPDNETEQEKINRYTATIKKFKLAEVIPARAKLNQMRKRQLLDGEQSQE